MNHMHIRIIVLFTLLCLIPFACTKKNIRSSQAKTGLLILEDLSHEERSKLLLGYITDFNKEALTTISAKFYIDAINNKKKVKSMGEIVYQKKNNEMNITFFDLIFKSPLTYIFQSKDILKLYFPVDRKLFVDNIKSIKLKHYISFNIDYQIIQNLITGRIPLLEGYRLKKINSSKAEKGTFLVMENGDYYETLSFKGKRPDKMLLIDKQSGEKYEIYFKRYYKRDGQQYFKNIRFSAKEGDVKIDISFKNITLNQPVKVKSMDDFKIRKGLKIIQMTE